MHTLVLLTWVPQRSSSSPSWLALDVSWLWKNIRIVNEDMENLRRCGYDSHSSHQHQTQPQLDKSSYSFSTMQPLQLRIDDHCQSSWHCSCCLYIKKAVSISANEQWSRHIHWSSPVQLEGRAWMHTRTIFFREIMNRQESLDELGMEDILEHNVVRPYEFWLLHYNLCTAACWALGLGWIVHSDSNEVPCRIQWHVNS